MPEHGPDHLTHVDGSGKARMVDVTAKAPTIREAEARGSIAMQPATLALIRENSIGKGDVLGVARIAGILAAKRTDELIPLCHGLPLSDIQLEFTYDDALPGLQITGRARTEARTGVEMEALTAVTLAALTVYDMCKAVDRGMTIGQVRLTYKSGGMSGTYRSD